MKLFVLSLCLLTIAIACSHMQSGQYVQLRPSDNLEQLAKEFNTTVQMIRASNPSAHFASGDWIFVPTKRGLIGQSDRWGRSQTPSPFLEHGALLWPVPSSSRVSSPYGRRRGRMHEGIDIPAREGSHILAAESGVVVYSGQELGGYGKITVISHPQGFFTVYAHAMTNFLKAGDKVHRGQAIAQVGSTGRSTGAHLHFEVRIDSQALDPIAFFSD